MAELPSIRDAVQRSENMRKNSFLNYKYTLARIEGDDYRL
jgi:hypothetical protein